MVACLLSGDQTRIEVFRGSCLPGGTDQRNSTVPSSQNGKTFVIRGKAISFNHLLLVLDFLTTLYHQGLTYTASTPPEVHCPVITLEDGKCVGKHAYIVFEGTYAETCCVDFISDRISENIDHMVFANNYIFQLVGHLKQSRPVVKNPLVKLKAFADKTLCVVTTLKEYPTRAHTLRGSEANGLLAIKDLSDRLVEIL